MLIASLPKMLGQHDEKCTMCQAYVMPGLTDCSRDLKFTSEVGEVTMLSRTKACTLHVQRIEKQYHIEHLNLLW